MALLCQYSASLSLSHCSSASLSLSQWRDISLARLSPGSLSQWSSDPLGNSASLGLLSPTSLC